MAKYSNYPPILLAEKIYIEALEKTLDNLKDEYEKLLFTDLDNPN